MNKNTILIIEPIHSKSDENYVEETQTLSAPKAVEVIDTLEISPHRLGKEISKYIRIAETVAEPKESNYMLTEMEVNLGITVEGSLGILGSGVKSGANASIKLKITKKSVD